MSGSLIAAWIPAVITVFAAAVTYGRYTSTQSDHSDKLKEHDEQIEKHGDHLGRIDIALVRLEEYNRGFADATRLGSK